MAVKRASNAIREEAEELHQQLRVEGSLATVYVWTDFMVTLPLQGVMKGEVGSVGSPM